jgi:hypothetical protein
MNVMMLTLAAILLAPAIGFAHGRVPQPTHGGYILDAQGSWLELVVSGDRVSVYVTDEHGDQVPVLQISGTVNLLIGGEMHKVQLAAAENNELMGRVDVPASGGLVATVSLKIGTKTATARFAEANR